MELVDAPHDEGHEVVHCSRQLAEDVLEDIHGVGQAEVVVVVLGVGAQEVIEAVGELIGVLTLGCLQLRAPL